MSPVKCMIVDDEPLSRDILRKFIKEVRDLELVSECKDAFEATHQLGQIEVDILFLDINMPGLTGISMARSLSNPPLIIFTTAYPQFAVEGFELDALDYLVKPITFERFMRSVAKYNRYVPKNPDDEFKESSFDHAYMFIKVNKEQVKLLFKDILFIESLKDYIRITTRNFSYITYNRLSYMDEVLPENRFVRIHKSYIISISELKSYRSGFVTIGNAELPVGRIYKQGFLDTLSRWKGETS